MKKIEHNFGNNIRIFKEGVFFPKYRLEIDTKATFISESETLLGGTHTSWHRSMEDIKKQIGFHHSCIDKAIIK